MKRAALVVLHVSLTVACSQKGTSQTSGASTSDATAPGGAFCSLPGSVVFTAKGPRVVPGADASAPSLAWLSLPAGFCAHYFATLGNTRQLRFAPDGRLFAASPTQSAMGGASHAGIASIVVLPDDDHDGVADRNVTYLGQLPSTQGLLFTGGYLYFQDDASIKRVPFANGDLSPSGPVQTVTTITQPQAPQHWPKVMDVARDGTIFVTNGGAQDDACLSTNPTRGCILSMAGATTTVVAKGFRNPIALRCEPDHDVCLAAELGLDFSAARDGREKIVPVRPGDDWGFPCCATKDAPYTGVVYSDTQATPDCSGAAQENVAFAIGHTPFGLDFERGKWPAPWAGRLFVTLHGDFEHWTGARIVGVSLDPATGLPLAATDLDGGDSGHMSDFATGWDDGSMDHGRPAAITFAKDGRLFVGDDQAGAVIWIAPVDLAP
jgi:glucose/arabinose dehydrogenase